MTTASRMTRALLSLLAVAVVSASLLCQREREVCENRSKPERRAAAIAGNKTAYCMALLALRICLGEIARVSCEPLVQTQLQEDLSLLDNQMETIGNQCVALRAKESTPAGAMVNLEPTAFLPFPDFPTPDTDAGAAGSILGPWSLGSLVTISAFVPAMSMVFSSFVM